MRGHHVLGNHLRRLSATLCGFLVVMLAVPMALAQSGEFLERGQPIPENIRVVGTNATGVDTQMTVRYLNPAGNTTFHKVPVAVGVATLGKLGKGTLKRVLPGVGIYNTMKDIIEGVGWAIDELQQQVMAPGQPGAELGTTAFCIPDGTSFRCANSTGQLLGAATQIYAQDPFKPPCDVIPHPFAEGFSAYRCATMDNSGMALRVTEQQVTRPGPVWPVQYINDNPGSEPSVVSDQDLGNLLKQKPQVVNAILIDPETGAPIRTQEVVDALNRLRRALEAANGTTTPAPDLEVDDGWENGEETPSDTHWPGFCEWATTVCDFIEWVKSDGEENKELPETELDIQSSQWTSGIGGGECPVSEALTVSHQGVQGEVRFDWQPLCQGATTLKPFLIAVCVMVAGFIISGLRKSAV